MCPTPPSPDWLPLATFTVQTGTLIGAAAVAVAALWQAATARKRHQEQTSADRERRITESFAKAVEQLGNDKQIATRLGGIYTLERIAQESKREYWPIMETLTAFVREPRDETTRLPTDIQAVLTVLGRRNKKARKRDEQAKRHLNLAGAQLELAYLSGAHFERANLHAAHLEGANLRGAYLQRAHLDAAYLKLANLSAAHLQHANLEAARLQGAGTTLMEAELEGANLEAARLEGALLWRACLKGARLRGAYLQGANLREARFEGADLREANFEGADLREAVGLTQEQLAVAFGDAKTKVDEELRPSHWPPAEEEPDNAE